MTAQIFAILNLTPDSFSDGEPTADVEFFLQKARQLVADGADVLDVGAESTRPDSQAISVEEELSRVLGFLKVFRHEYPDFPISLDSKKYEVVLQALPYGLNYINDVSFLADVRLAHLAKHSGAHYVLMHTRGNHAVMQNHCEYGTDLFATLKTEITAKLQILFDLDFPKSKIILDPGFGFAKTPVQCVELLDNLSYWQDFELPLLLGISRKRFLQHYCGEVPPIDRDSVSAEWAFRAWQAGFQNLRVHNVSLTKKLLTEPAGSSKP